MPTAKTSPRRPATPQRITSSLREDLARSSAPYKVDRDKGIIYGVKLVGRSSPNTHGVKGVEGTDYDPEALRAALPLYEGAAANIDHPDRDRPDKDRSAYDRLGRYRDCRIVAGEVYGDLHVLLTHPMAARVMEAAEKMPDAFACSHNASGEGEVRNARYVILHITEVRSVDIVADGGTCLSLFESRKHSMKTVQLKASIESAKYDLQKRARLLEAMQSCGLKEDEEIPVEAEEPGYEDHCAAMIGALVKDTSLSAEEKKKKVAKAMKLMDDESDGGGSTETEESEEEGEEEEEEGKPKKKPPTKTEESRKPKKKAAGTTLTADRCRSYCRLAGVEPAAPLLEALAATGDEGKALALLEYTKTLTKTPAPSPRSRQAGTHGQGGAAAPTPVLESRDTAPEKSEDLAAWLRG
jgi:hypothetical protein